MLNYKTYENIPDAKWVVMIHGAGGNMEVWFKQISAYSRHFNILLVDLACHGDSNQKEVFSESFDFDMAARQVLEVVDHLGIEKAHFVGLSLGSIIAHAVVKAAPERAYSMVLVGAVTCLSLMTKFLLNFVRCCRFILPFALIKRLLADSIIPQQKYAESKSLFLRCAQKVTYDGFMQWMSLLSIADSYLKRLVKEDLNTPTLYVMGEDDHLFLSNVRSVVANSGDNVSLSVIKKAGHVCNVDNKDEFNRVSLGFLTQC
ncbi:MAG: alpha/beta hydrolase [Alistipes sp.]|nr:alpha/beta hydrolase [Alistipes sp.]